MSSLRILIFGGHGKVAQHLTRHALGAGHTVYSVLRQEAHAIDLPQPPKGGNGGGVLNPVVQSIENSSVSSLIQLLQEYNPQVIVWSAGAGGKGGPQRTRAVDYEGAVKVFDAIQAAHLKDFQRLILVSAIDVRDVNQPAPEWYSASDVEVSKKLHGALKYYYEQKLAADQNLIQRPFRWVILRPGLLKDAEQGTGKVNLGARTPIDISVYRDDVGRVLLALAEEPVGSKLDHLALDLTNGETPIPQALDEARLRGRTDFSG